MLLAGGIDEMDLPGDIGRRTGFVAVDPVGIGRNHRRKNWVADRAGNRPLVVGHIAGCTVVARRIVGQEEHHTLLAGSLPAEEDNLVVAGDMGSGYVAGSRLAEDILRKAAGRIDRRVQT